MSDFFLHLSDSTACDINKAINEFRNIYESPVIDINKSGNCHSLIVNNSSHSFIKPIYSKLLQKHLWVYGKPYITQDIKNKYQISSEITEPDEILRLLYEKKGIEVFTELNGWFNIISFSEVNAEIEIINSHLGMLPLYFYIDNNKIIISSRLSLFYKYLENVEIDKGTAAQQCLYNYPFSDRTHIKNVFRIPSATILKIQNKIASRKKYWNAKDEFTESPLNVRKSTELLNETLDSVIRRISNVDGKLALSLTGGWDGRLILAYILKFIPPENIILYSFGSNYSPDVSIPLNISEKYGFNYIPIYLDEKYLQENFLEFAKKTILFSDSIRSLRRAHYLYAMNLLKDKSTNIITGIGGSNLLKSTAVAPSNVFNKNVLNLLFSDNPENEIKSQYDFVKTINNYFSGLEYSEFRNSYDNKDLDFLFNIKNKNERFCNYLLSDIERKYFGYEVSSYGHLVQSYSPFLDYEFLKNLLKTSFFGGYNKIKFLPSFQNSMLYARLIGRNNKFLIKENTDRNFSQESFTNPLKLFKSGFNYFFNNYRNIKNLYYTERSTKLFLESEFPELNKLNYVNNDYSSNFISLSWYIKTASEGKYNLLG